MNKWMNELIYEIQINNVELRWGWTTKSLKCQRRGLYVIWLRKSLLAND